MDGEGEVEDEGLANRQFLAVRVQSDAGVDLKDRLSAAGGEVDAQSMNNAGAMHVSVVPAQLFAVVILFGRQVLSGDQSALEISDPDEAAGLVGGTFFGNRSRRQGLGGGGEAEGGGRSADGGQADRWSGLGGSRLGRRTTRQA